jgi:hypothetical protein
MEKQFMFVPMKLDSNRTHNTKRAFYYKNLVIYAMTESPLHFMFEAHVVVGVDTVLGSFEIFWEWVEVIEFKLKS